jgi:hypothetical protein
MMIRSDVVIQVVCAPRWDRAAAITWRATVDRGAKPPDRNDAWFQMMQMADHAESRLVCASIADHLQRENEDLALCWRLLAVDPQDPTGLSELLTTVCTAVRAADFDAHPELLPRLEVIREVARGKHKGEFGSLFHLASTHHHNHTSAPPAVDEDVRVIASRPAAVDLLDCTRWDEAFGWIYTETERELARRDVGWLYTETERGLVRRDVEILADILGDHDRKVTRERIQTLIEMLYEMATPTAGALALAWQMLTVDPKRPESFMAVLPQLQWSFDHANWTTNQDERNTLNERLRIWWRGAEGAWIHRDVSIFRIAYVETSPEPHIEPIPESRPVRSETAKEPSKSAGPTLVVMPLAKSTKLNNYNAPFKDLVDAALPLVVARDVARIRATLHAEFPHATVAVDLLLRDLREGQPVTLKPVILLGSVGTGKSRLVRRLADLLLPRMYVHRVDASSTTDGHFGGTSKGWGNTEASVPMRAIARARIANPIVMIDEIEKASAGVHSNGGRLWDSLIAFLDRETSARYRDQSLDAEVDLSAVSYVCCANDVTRLPTPLRDRFRIIRVAEPTMAHLPQLAAQVMRDLSIDDETRTHDASLADDELAVIGKAWSRAGFSMRKLQKIVGATLEARDQYAMRH